MARPFKMPHELAIKYSNVFDDFVKKVESYSPDLIALSATEDMFELGVFSKKFHLQIKKNLKDNKISNVYTIGKEMKNLSQNLSKSFKAEHFDNLNELNSFLKKNVKSNDVILFKGSRAMQLDKIIKNLGKI